MLSALEVIWIYDALLRQPHPKMVVCVDPSGGQFFRINTLSHLRPCILLPKFPDHPWLDHDSYLQIDPIVLDDYIVEMALERSGVIGRVSPELKRDIIKYTLDLRYIPLADKQAICNALRE